MVNAWRKADEDEHEIARMRSFELANLIAFAHHDPKKMPEYKRQSDADQPVSDELSNARARGALIAMALRGKG